MINFLHSEAFGTMLFQKKGNDSEARFVLFVYRNSQHQVPKETDMNNLKRLCLIIGLTLVLAASAFAGETQTPPCAPPDPGEVHAPPCEASPLTSDDPTLGQTSTPPSSNTLTEYVVADAAIDFVESVLSLF